MSKKPRKKSRNNFEPEEGSPRHPLEYYDNFFTILDNKFPGIVAKLYWFLILEYKPEKADQVITAFYTDQITEGYPYAQSPNCGSIIPTRKGRRR